MTAVYSERFTCIGCEEPIAPPDAGTWATVFNLEPGMVCYECLLLDEELADPHGVGTYLRSVSKIDLIPGTELPPRVKCNHYRDPLVLPSGHEVYLSSVDGDNPEHRTSIDLMIFLDHSWLLDGYILSNQMAPVENQDKPFYFIRWPDMTALTLDQFIPLLNLIGPHVVNGQNVQIGCIGGHGRTGTVAAALCIMGGMEYDKAVDYVREVYCAKAVETFNQKKLLWELWTDMNPDLPVPPPVALAPRTTARIESAVSELDKEKEKE